ncbi:MAG: hypothetical protein JXL97_19990 [Bacteroidales bacterium]|nr:hypothetical protein [Bacteroidales bacterium]
MIKKLVLLFIAGVLVMSCNENANTNIESDSTNVTSITYPSTGNFYSVPDGESLIVADPIIYDVIVKNADPSDEWTSFCLENVDIEAITNILFNAVYQEKLLPYHYRLDTIIPMEEVKNLEKEIRADQIAKLQFEEQWFFDETNLEMYKKVSYIVFGLELINETGEVYGYKPGFKVYLDKDKNQIAK